MSSLIVYSNESGVYIGTDTISHLKGENDLIPSTFITKTIYLPQFKCCFAVQGYAFLINQLFLFSMTNVVAYDASSFFEACKNSFSHFLDTSACQQEDIGTVFIMGFSIQAQSMCTYKIIVNKHKLDFETMGNVSFIKPMISNYEEIQQRMAVLMKDQHPYDYHKSLITEIMKQQIVEDKALPLKDKVGIGGQLQLTFVPPIGENSSISYLVEIAHTFDDYLNNYQTMLDQIKR